LLSGKENQWEGGPPHETTIAGQKNLPFERQRRGGARNKEKKFASVRSEGRKRKVAYHRQKTNENSEKKDKKVSRGKNLSRGEKRKEGGGNPTWLLARLRKKAENRERQTFNLPPRSAKRNRAAKKLAAGFDGRKKRKPNRPLVLYFEQQDTGGVRQRMETHFCIRSSRGKRTRGKMKKDWW